MILAKETFTKGMVIALVVMFAGFAGSSIAFSKSITIKVGSYDAPLELTLDKTNGNYASTNVKAQVFKSLLESASGGKFKVKVYPAGQLGNDREALEMVRDGTMQVNAYPGNPMSNWVPEVLAYQIPYLFKDTSVALRVLNGPLGEELRQLIIKKTGIRVLQWGFEGPYANFQSIKKPIHVPSDLKGQKIRVMETPSMHEIVKVAGGTPTPVPWTEIYTSMQQGVIDGLECPLPFVRMAKVDEVIKYICKADFYLAFSNFHVNEKFYQSLSPADRYLIVKCALEAMRVYDGMVLFSEPIWVDYFKKKGIEVYYPTPKEMEIWRQTIRPHMIKWTKKQIGSEWVDKFLKASEDAERELYGD
ncbi:MAG: TRAP transporter substrate-binding protein [Deltaproteobacteria bacterium]|nr:TRAP transporter substrate-binding protein [Deltaproteobacteria bacterium]MBW2120384.1 TRAP transporter substrate-binding protein [Deltaproteobacteria bacterium]